MSKKKRKRNRDLVILWKGKVSRVLGQGSDSEVMLLARLVMHKQMTHDEKYLVLEGAIFEVWGQRLADREEERRERRKRARGQRQAREARRDWEEMETAIAHQEIRPADTGEMPQAPIPDTAKPEH